MKNQEKDKEEKHVTRFFCLDSESISRDRGPRPETAGRSDLQQKIAVYVKLVLTRYSISAEKY